MDVSMGKSNMNAGFSPAMFDYRRVCHIWIHLPAILGFSRGTSKVSSPHAPHTHFLWLKMGPDCILRDAHFSSGKWWSTMINPPFFLGILFLDRPLYRWRKHKALQDFYGFLTMRDFLWMPVVIPGWCFQAGNFVHIRPDILVVQQTKRISLTTWYRFISQLYEFAESVVWW